MRELHRQRLRPLQFVFLCFAVTFGFSLLVQLVSDGEDRDLVSLLILPAVYGIGMSVFFVVSQTYGTRLRRHKVLSDALTVRPEVEYSIRAGRDVVFERCVEAVQSIRGVRSWNADGKKGVITASVGWSWMSWGETVRVEVRPGAAGMLVRIASKPKLPTTIADYGKNVRNVEAVLRTLGSAFPDCQKTDGRQENTWAYTDGM